MMMMIAAIIAGAAGEPPPGVEEHFGGVNGLDAQLLQVAPPAGLVAADLHQHVAVDTVVYELVAVPLLLLLL